MSLRDTLQASLGSAFTIERDIGADEMPRAFVARDNGSGREVLIEVLQPDLAGVVDIARFKREIAFAARLEDPQVVPLLSAGETDGVPYVVMQLVEGESLTTRLAKKVVVPADEAMRILRDVASALAHGHERGVVHRALRADDVILSGASALVTNLGVARALYAAGAPGDSTIDNRSDIYAFGVVGYELLTGQAPLPDLPEPIQKFRPSLPTGLAPLIMRCLRKNPAERPQTASEVVRELDEIINPSDSILAALWPVESPTLIARSDYYRMRGLFGLVAVTLLMIVAGYFVWRNSNRTASGAPAPVVPKRIAVFPLVNVAGDTATQYFADGVTDEVTSTLAQLPGVQVASLSATAAAVTADTGDVKSVGNRLRLDAVLTTQMRRVGDHVHLVAQLKNASSAADLWTATYDRDASDVFQLEDDVARGVAGALHITLGPGQQLATRGTKSAKAHDLYLHGRFLLTKRSDLELSQALGMFQQALKDDPNYVMAWSGVADSWAMLSNDFVAPKEAVPHLRDAVAHGLALDSSNAELRFSHGLIAYLYDLNGRAAQQYMSAAIAADPDLPNATAWYPQVLWTNGLIDSARAYLRHATDRDSTSPSKLLDAWSFAKGSRNALDALEYCGRLDALRAGAQCDALNQLDVSRPDQALDLFQHAAKDAGMRGLDAQLAYVTVLVTANRLDTARALVAAVDHEAAVSPGQYIREDDIALMHGMIGDNDAALRWYDKALASGSAGIGSLYWRSAANPLRNDPRLLAFAKRAGLTSPPAYWP